MDRGEKGMESLQYLTRIGKIDKRVSIYIDYVSLSEIFGWTPEEIDKQDPKMIQIYKAILSGRKKNPPESRQIKKGMKNG